MEGIIADVSSDPDVCAHRATSNETLISGTNLKQALKTLYPLLGENDLEEFDQVYSADQFGSEEERFRTGTGEPNLLCGVCFFSLFRV